MNSLFVKNNLSFGQKIPTLEFLKSASNIQRYPEARRLCLAIENRFPGSKGYMGRAEELAGQVEKRNPKLSPILASLRALKDPKSQEEFIQNYILENGHLLDVVI